MAGHSKWANTKHRKAAVDSKRGKIFSAISKDMTVAARCGGGDPEFNPRLRTLLLKARAANMPADNIDRAIKKGTGELPGVSYEELVYEGFAHGGVGFVIDVTTDNKNRAVASVRSVFSKAGYELAKQGALMHTFSRMGQIVISKDKVSEDKLMEIALDAGADDILTEGDEFEVRCGIGSYDAVASAIEKAGIPTESSEIAWVPSVEVQVTDADMAKSLLKIVDALEDLEDVQNVYTNMDIADGLIGD